jgi:tetratricopeptide (TPR) repeat protein
MTGGAWVRRLAAPLAVAAALWGIALAGAAQAQQQDDLARLRAEVSRLHAEGKYAEAAPVAERYVALARQRGEESPVLAAAVAWLGNVYKAQGRYAEAEPAYRRSLAIWEKALGPEHPDVATALVSLAGLYLAQGRYAEAEPAYRRSLAIREKALGPDHPDVATALNNLAELYRAQGRYAEAEPAYRQSLAIREKALGPEHPDVAAALNNLASLYQAQGRYGEAEPVFRRSLAIREKALGPEHPSVATALNNLADLYRAQGRYAEAEPAYRRSLAIWEKVLGPEHPYVSTALNNLAALYRAQGRYAEAEPAYKRSLAIAEKALGPDHPDVGQSLNNLAWLALDRSDWAGAAGYWRRSTDVIERRTLRGLGGGAEGSSKGEAQRLSWYFAGLVKTTHRLAADGRAPGAPAAEMFETAQWAQASEAAASLAQMAARSAAGSPELAALVRERQDLVGEYQAKDKQLIAAKTQEPARRNAGAETALSDRLAAIDARLGEIGGRLARDFPDYAALASPAPVPLAEVQAQLRPDEALVLFLDTPEWKSKAPNAPALPEETFVWVVTKSEMRWVRSELGTAALQSEVAALRCGLDATLWADPGWWPERTDEQKREKAAQAARRRRCLDLGLAEPAYDGQGNPWAHTLPVDHARAWRLYTSLFGQVRDLIAGKHLLIVPSGALTQLPFQVLATEPPADGVRPCGSGPRAQPCVGDAKDKAKVKGSGMGSDPQGPIPAWLVRSHAVSILPAVSSLKALRRFGRPSVAPRALIGFGNPLLDGPDARYAKLASLARERRSCPVGADPEPKLAAARAGVARVATRGGLADLAQLKGAPPLPETADELCAVAESLKVDARDIHLGAEATEGAVKRLSATGQLAKYRMLHFATHGVTAGELAAGEPGLILTPPAAPSEEDDGYLAASEIAAPKLDADWVILSACNTAAGGAANAEALSGLARAFIYAGARALLVSHWEVDSAATVRLVTVAVEEMTRDPKVGRAEAMRRAMLALVDHGRPEQAHPSYWARGPRGDERGEW